MNWYKFSQRGNIELINNPYGLQDPYRRNKKREEGYDLSRPGDEEGAGASSFGGRFRGQQSPTGFQQRDGYEKQRDRDIPVCNHMFLDDHDGRPADGQGVGTQFEDARDSVFVSDKLKVKDEPIGPHNMEHKKPREQDIFNRVRKSIHN